MLAMLLGCSLRRSELVGLAIEKIQMRQGHWVIVDLGKGGHIRTSASGVSTGKLFRAIGKDGTVHGDGLCENAVWCIVGRYCGKIGLDNVAPHDLRRTCAKLCHASGGELEQIQFLLGHASVQTTERYLGCKQNLSSPVNDRFNIASLLQSTD